MDGFEIDIEAMKSAHRYLGELRDQLAGQLSTAGELVDSVRRSKAPIHDPVADKLHDVYVGRADANTGVHALLEEYLEELDDIQLIIATTLQAYADKDAGAAHGIQGASGKVD